MVMIYVLKLEIIHQQILVDQRVGLSFNEIIQSTDKFLFLAEHSYRQVTLFPTCEIEQLKTELKDDGFLHIKVPIKL